MAQLFLINLVYMTLNVYEEARDQPFDGQVAVCQVVMNRADVKKKSAYDIITQPYQFSWTMGVDHKTKLVDAMKDYHIFEECYKAVEECVKLRTNGDTLGGATHYYNPKLVQEPDWVKDCKYICSIHDHMFYKGRF
jgi:N-acetylmuramoyl-L-alanine amidase